MNYDRVKNIFIDLYKELSETFDNFETDFAEAIGKQILQKPTIVFVRDGHDKIVEYFEKITQSKETVETFIKELLAPAVRARGKFDVSSSYHYVVAKEARTSNIEVGRDPQANYAAFKRKLLSTFGLTQKDLHELIRDAYNNLEDTLFEQLERAELYPTEYSPEAIAKIKYFEKITESKDAAQKFIKEVLAPIANSRSRLDVSNSYHQVMARETATSMVKVSRDSAVNYTAFKRKLATDFKIYKKDILALIKDLANNE